MWVKATAAKVADKVETIALKAMYAKDFVTSIAKSTIELGKNVAMWVKATTAKVADAVAQAAMTAATVAWNAVCAIATTLTSAFGATIAFLTSPIGIVILAIGALIAVGVLLWKNWDKVKAKATETWNSIKETFFNAVNPIIQSTFVQDIKSMFSEIISFIKNVFTGEWAAAWSSIKDVFKNIINGIIIIFESAINFIVAGLNKIKFDVPEWVPGIGGKNFGFNFNKVKLPRLATGAVIPPNSEFLAVLGDQKRGVNIETPLETMIQAFKTALSGGNYGRVSITIPVVLEGKQIYETVVDYNNGEVRRTGTSKLKV